MAFKHLKIGKAPSPSEVYAEMILASGDVGKGVLMEHCQKVLNGKGMPADWSTSVAMPLFEGKIDIMDYGMCRGVKLPQHGTFV